MAQTSPSPVEIRQVANGFVVQPVPHNWRHGSAEATPEDTQLVFQTMTELVYYLQGHFDHRRAGVANDDLSTFAFKGTTP